MTRDQALAIVNNIDLITHFANGGLVAVPINGQMFKSNTLIISNFRSDRPPNYKIIKKPHYRYSYEKGGCIELPLRGFTT